MMSWSDLAHLWGKALDQKVEYREISLEEFKKRFPLEGEELLSATYSAEFGYAGHDSAVMEPKDFGFANRPEEIEKWMAEQDWSAVLNAEPVEGL